jgi:hypothetical protein
MALRRMVMAGLLGVALATASPAHALTQGEEAGFALLAAWGNVLYVPAKTIACAVSMPVGALAGWLSGGDERSAYAIWVPMAGGTWFLTPAHLEGREPIAFFGDDYADRPSTASPGANSALTYQSLYEPMDQ